MKLRRKLFSGLVATVVGTTLILQPVAPAGASTAGRDGLARAGLADAPDLSGRADVTELERVVFHATPDATATGPDAVPGNITCLLNIINPRVAEVPIQILATGNAICDWPMPSISVGLALFRGDDAEAVSSNVETEFLTFSVTTHTFTSCRSGVYFATVATTIVAPPGYSPSVIRAFGASDLVPISVGETGVLPFICEEPQAPPPPPDPPVIDSLNCQVSARINLTCTLSARNWTQIRWTVAGELVSPWNNLTSVQGDCMSLVSNSEPGIELEVREIPVKVAVSNAEGTSHKQDNVSCLVHS
jgi:hypothetical protein